MNIYIEDFIFQNLIINFCLLRLIKLTTKTITTTTKLIVASLLSALLSLFSTLYISNLTLCNIIKITSMLMMLIIGFKQTKKQMFLNVILLFILNYSFYGVINSFSSFFYYTNFGIISVSNINLSHLPIAFLILSYIYEFYCKQAKIKHKQNNYIYKICLKHNKKTITTQAFLDTGNMLNYLGEPVIILDLNTYLNLTNINLINFYLTPAKEINLSTLAGNEKLKLFQIDELTVIVNNKRKIIKNQYVAINNNNIFTHTNYHALLSSGLI